MHSFIYLYKTLVLLKNISLSILVRLHKLHQGSRFGCKRLLSACLLAGPLCAIVGGRIVSIDGIADATSLLRHEHDASTNPFRLGMDNPHVVIECRIALSFSQDVQALSMVTD